MLAGILTAAEKVQSDEGETVDFNRKLHGGTFAWLRNSLYCFGRFKFGAWPQMCQKCETWRSEKCVW